MTEDEMVGWHHRLNRYEFEQTPGDIEGQGCLTCYNPRGHKESHNLVTEQQQSELLVFFFFSFKEIAEEVLGEIYHFLNIDN